MKKFCVTVQIIEVEKLGAPVLFKIKDNYYVMDCVTFGSSSEELNIHATFAEVEDKNDSTT